MYKVETEQETDGRWIAEVPELRGRARVRRHARRGDPKGAGAVAARPREHLEHGEDLPQVENVFAIVG